MKKTVQTALLLFAGSAALIGCQNRGYKKDFLQAQQAPKYWQDEICNNAHPDLAEAERDSLYRLMENGTMVTYRQEEHHYKENAYRDSLVDGYILNADKDTLAYVRHFTSHDEYNSYTADTFGYATHDYVCDNIVMQGGEMTMTRDHNVYKKKLSGRDSVSTVYSVFRYKPPVDTTCVDTACAKPVPKSGLK